MAKFGEVHNFNTGCWYGPKGQPISWATFQEDGVEGIIYQDHARGITKAIPMPGDAGYTNYCGEKTMKVVGGRVDNIYVRECERIGLTHATMEWKLDREFQMLPKGQIAYIEEPSIPAW